MKITVTADCTPAEARAFLGLPDLEPLHAVYVSRTEEWLRGQGLADLVRSFGGLSGLGAGLGAGLGSGAGSGASGSAGAAPGAPLGDPAAVVEAMVKRWAPMGEAGLGLMRQFMGAAAGPTPTSEDADEVGIAPHERMAAGAVPPGASDEAAAHPS